MQFLKHSFGQILSFRQKRLLLSALPSKVVLAFLLYLFILSSTGAFANNFYPDNLFEEIIEGKDSHLTSSECSTFRSSFFSRKFYSLMSFKGRRLARNSCYEVQNRPFFKHVIDAISINKERARIYSTLSNGKSQKLSAKLISLEYAILPMAKFLDKRALKYQKQGIPVLIEDFVPMENLNSPYELTSHTGEMTKEVVATYFLLISDFKGLVLKLARKKEFKKLEERARASLHSLRALEDATNCSFAMGKHLVESVVLSAENGSRYNIMSDGETDNIVAANLILQGVAFFPLCELDVKAADLHEEGIGIIINDLPVIID